MLDFITVEGWGKGNFAKGVYVRWKICEGEGKERY